MGYRPDNIYYFRATISGDMQHLGRALFQHLVVDDTTEIKIEPLRYCGPDDYAQPFIARGLHIEVTFVERFATYGYQHSPTYDCLQNVVGYLWQAHEHTSDPRFAQIEFSLYTKDNLDGAGTHCHPSHGYEIDIETGQRVEDQPRVSVVKQLRERAAAAKAALAEGGS